MQNNLSALAVATYALYKHACSFCSLTLKGTWEAPPVSFATNVRVPLPSEMVASAWSYAVFMLNSAVASFLAATAFFALVIAGLSGSCLASAALVATDSSAPVPNPSAPFNLDNKPEESADLCESVTGVAIGTSGEKLKANPLGTGVRGVGEGRALAGGEQSIVAVGVGEINGL